MKKPYPFDGLICSLIHDDPSNIDDAKSMLEHSWFPKGGEFGEHSWYDEDAINWQKMKIKGRKYLDLADFSPYLDDTGLKNLSLDDWIETISYVAKSTGYEDFEIKRSPSGEKILLLEMLPSGTDYAVEIHQNGDVFSLRKEKICTELN